MSKSELRVVKNSQSQGNTNTELVRGESIILFQIQIYPVSTSKWITEVTTLSEIPVLITDIHKHQYGITYIGASKSGEFQGIRAEGIRKWDIQRLWLPYPWKDIDSFNFKRGIEYVEEGLLLCSTVRARHLGAPR